MAQEEARDMSENVKWTVLKRFNEGKLFSMTILGYRLNDGVLVVVPEEARIVKLIYSLYLKGLGMQAIAAKLNKLGFKSRFNRRFTYASIRGVLLNEVYTGNITLQSTFRENFITKKTIKNQGQKKMWRVEEAHEPIIDSKTFTKVQKQLAARGKESITIEEPNPFQDKLLCPYCNRHFSRKFNKGKPYYICNYYDKYGKDECPNKKIPLSILEKVTSEVLEIESFDATLFSKKIEQIIVYKDRKLLFCFKDGRQVEKEWSYPSRSESWTPEMKEMVRQRNFARREKLTCQE